MASTPYRKSRSSRTGDIPDNLISKWQSAGPKPLVRRPMTACQACRAAKVRCDNKRQCNRCVARGLVCTYTNINTQPDTPPPSHPSSAVDGPSPPATHAQPVDRTGLHALDAPMDAIALDEPFDMMPDWMPDAAHQALDDFVWPRTDGPLSAASPAPTATGRPPPALGYEDQNLTAATSLFHPDFANAMTTSSTDFSQSNLLFHLPKCQCRESLVTLVPKVTSAMQAKQLDQVFKGMQRVVQGFQGIVCCTDCHIT
ncbi:hypothetical protein ACEQ8H_001338 [Pleosporales sp. CAS-2024a]